MQVTQQSSEKVTCEAREKNGYSIALLKKTKLLTKRNDQSGNTCKASFGNQVLDHHTHHFGRMFQRLQNLTIWRVRTHLR